VIQFKPEIFGEYLLLLPELARLKSLLEVASRGVAFSHLMATQAVPLMMRLGGESGPKRLLTLLELLAMLSRDAQSAPCAQRLITFKILAKQRAALKPSTDT
jgi:hypothetical protein